MRYAPRNRPQTVIQRVNDIFGRFIDLAISRSQPADARQRRSRSVVRGTITAIAARAFGTVTGLIMVPLTLRYLGATRYGAWMTISSFLLFLNFTDFGLTSSLTNALGKAFGEDKPDDARKYVTTTLLTLVGVGAFLMIAGLFVAEPAAKLMFPQLDQALMHREIIPALLISIAIFALSFPMMITNRVLAAYQENTKANVWVAVSSAAGLVGAVVAVVLRVDLPFLVLATSGSGLVVTAASTLWLFGWHKKWLRPMLSDLDRSFLRDLFSSGWKFFVINVGWLINSQTDNIIIAHYLGPTQVTPYSVTFRLFAYTTLIQTFAISSLWPAYTEAVTRKDFEWVQGIYRKNLKWSLVIAIGLLVPLVLFGQTIIRFWAGEAAIPPFSLIAWIAVWNLMLAHLNVPGCLLTATGHITGMATYCSLTAILNVILSILLVQHYGITGVIAATVIAYCVTSYVPMIVEARMVLKTLAHS